MRARTGRLVLGQPSDPGRAVKRKVWSSAQILEIQTPIIWFALWNEPVLKVVLEEIPNIKTSPSKVDVGVFFRIDFCFCSLKGKPSKIHGEKQPRSTLKNFLYWLLRLPASCEEPEPQNMSSTKSRNSDRLKAARQHLGISTRPSIMSLVKGGNIKGSKGKHQVHLWKVLPLALLPPKNSSVQTTGPLHRIKMTAAYKALWNPFHHCFFLCCCLSWTLTLHKQLFWSNASIHANRPL